jgi:hypothetical protein
VLRSVGAVLLGYLVFWVLLMAFSVGYFYYLTGRLPDADASGGTPTLSVCITYMVVGWSLCVVSGYVTAWVARRLELAHAIGLTAVMIAGGSAYFGVRVAHPDRPDPIWYVATTSFVLPLLSVPLGGMLRARHVKARGLAPEAH